MAGPALRLPRQSTALQLVAVRLEEVTEGRSEPEEVVSVIAATAEPLSTAPHDARVGCTVRSPGRTERPQSRLFSTAPQPPPSPSDCASRPTGLRCSSLARIHRGTSLVVGPAIARAGAQEGITSPLEAWRPDERWTRATQNVSPLFRRPHRPTAHRGHTGLQNRQNSQETEIIERTVDYFQFQAARRSVCEPRWTAEVSPLVFWTTPLSVTSRLTNKPRARRGLSG